MHLLNLPSAAYVFYLKNPGLLYTDFETLEAIMQELTESEKKSRKIWLWIVIGFAVIEIFCDIFTLIDTTDACKVRTTAQIWAAFTVVIVRILSSLVPYFLLYYFAYKKMGTKYLTFVLLVNPLVFVKELLVQIPQIEKEYALFLIPYHVLFISTYIYWYVLGWRLRKMNKRIRKLPKEVPCPN